MFGKKPSDTALANRVRSIAERPAPPRSLAPTRATRQSVFRNATIILDGGARFTVAIKDLSEGGARIEFFQDLPLDHEFVLSEPVSKLRRRVRMTWRKERAAGLQFLD